MASEQLQDFRCVSVLTAFAGWADHIVTTIVHWRTLHLTFSTFPRLSTGTALEIITDRSQEGSQFVSGFGGIGGLLRYRLDFAVLDVDVSEFDGVDLDDYI